LGLTKTGEYRSVDENVDEDILRLSGPLGELEIDLMTPLDPNAAPKVHQPALNHIGFWVDDLRAAVVWLAAKGVRFAPGGIRVGAAGHEVCFIHPRPNEEFPLSGEGVLVELVQAPAELVALAQRV
jgi:lactoylglutathione lyase